MKSCVVTLMQRTDSLISYAASCTVLTADESNYSAAGTTQSTSSLLDAKLLQCVIFLKSLLHFSKFSVNANVHLVTKYILRKKKITILFIYCSYGNIVNFLRTSRVHFCFKIHSKTPFKPMGRKTQDLHLPLGMWIPHLNHPSFD